MIRSLTSWAKYLPGFILGTLIAAILVPTYVLVAAATIQVAVCPLVYMGHGDPPTNPEARARWNPPGFTDCVSTSFGSASRIAQKIWK